MRYNRRHRISGAIRHKDTSDLFVKFVLQTLGSVTLLSLQISELCSNLPQNSEPSNSQLGHLTINLLAPTTVGARINP